jgi:hypothetical protein
MIFELGIGQQPALAELARKADYQADFVLDYQQIPRIMVAKK